MTDTRTPLVSEATDPTRILRYNDPAMLKLRSDARKVVDALIRANERHAENRRDIGALDNLLSELAGTVASLLERVTALEQATPRLKPRDDTNDRIVAFLASHGLWMTPGSIGENLGLTNPSNVAKRLDRLARDGRVRIRQEEGRRPMYSLPKREEK